MKLAELKKRLADVDYVAIRGHENLGHDLDILVAERDFHKVESMQHKKLDISIDLHFYKGSEKHSGVTFAGKKELAKKHRAKRTGLYTLVGWRYWKMKLLRLARCIWKELKKFMEWVRNEN